MGAILTVTASAQAAPDLLVSSEATNSVKRYDGASGAYKGDFVTAGLGTLSKPEGLAWGKDGNLYVSSSANNKVLRYHGVTGALLGVAFQGNGLARPWDRMTGPDGSMYVSSIGAGSNKVLRFNAANGQLMNVAATSTQLSAPDGLAIGPDGMLYVCSTGNNRVLKFNPATGALISTFITGASVGMSRPNDIVFGSDGRVYVLDNNGLFRFQADGTLIDLWKPGAGSPGLLQGADGLFYASSYGNSNVSRFGGPGEGVFIAENLGGLAQPTNMIFFVPSPGSGVLLLVGFGLARRRR